MFNEIWQLDGSTGERVMSRASTIYIVDDDEALRDSLKLLLEAYGCQVEDFRSTREFLGAFRRKERQCLLLDYQLPGETGLDFLESVDGAELGVPVILMTAAGDALLRARAAKAGARGYFDKPVDDCALVETIFRLIEAAA